MRPNTDSDSEGLPTPSPPTNVGGNLVFAALLGAFATLLLQSIGQFFKDPLWRAIFAIVGLCGLIVMLFGRRWLLDFFRKPSPILVVAAFAILFIVVIFGPFVQQQEWPIIPFFRLQPSDRLISEQDLPTPFAKNQIIAPMAPSNNTTNVLVLYTAELTAMGDNLRVFVDYSLLIPNGLGWSQRNRVEIAQFKSYVRGQRLFVTVISKYDDGETKNLMRWGAVESTPPDAEHRFALPNTMRARMVLLGSDGTEQHHYFQIIRGSYGSNDIIPYAVPEESFDSYRGVWEQSDK